MSMRVGLIGVGLMGHGIGNNLLLNGHTLTILGHKNRQPVEDLVAKGAKEARDPQHLAGQCDVVFLSVTGAPEVEEIVYGGNGILPGCRPGMILVDCTTSEPALSLRIRADLVAKGAEFADAALSRSPADAEAGRLNTMVGATDAVFAAIRPLLATFCENILHIGGPGAGHKIKLIYQFFSMGQVALIAEALCTCAASGIDLRQYYEVVSVSGGNSGIFQHLMTKLLQGDLGGLAFSLSNAEKDIRYYKRLAEEIPVTGALAKMVHHAYVQAMNLGLRDGPVGGMVLAQELLNGFKIVKR